MEAKEKEQLYIKYLRQTVLLLPMKELANFHFDINIANQDFYELGSLIANQGVNTKSYNHKIRPLAMKLLPKVFTKDKVNELKAILESIIKTYSNSPEIQKSALASKLFLEDENTKLNYLPIAIARLIEDTLKEYKKATGN